MIALVSAISFTLGVSAFCSMLEAFILSLSTSDIEDFKKTHPKKGLQLEHFKTDLEGSSSAILTLNTIANTLGTLIVGTLAAREFATHPSEKIIIFFISAFMVFGILTFSEILPKNMGVLYKQQLRSYLVGPLGLVRLLMTPISFLAKIPVSVLLKNKPEVAEKHQEKEILLLADKSALEGGLRQDERDMIFNTLNLDDINVSEIMTPRTVVMAFDKETTVDQLFTEHKVIPFARMPVYDDTIDEVVGLIRRRDILQARADDDDEKTMEELMGDVIFIPENASAADALQIFLKSHQQLAVVVDEFGSTSGVIAMEDVIEHILGQEIFEEDDVAIDMRELARIQAAATVKHREKTKGA